MDPDPVGLLPGMLKKKQVNVSVSVLFSVLFSAANSTMASCSSSRSSRVQWPAVVAAEAVVFNDQL